MATKKVIPIKKRKSPFGLNPPSQDLLDRLGSLVIGQSSSLASIAPYVTSYQAGLNPDGRPAGVFLLLGPTGTGKTRTVEALAESLHGSKRYMLRVDCGEYQMEHEVAKLIGSPPGYLGHRETQPVLTQAKLAATTSTESSLSLILFDEVEKSADSLLRLLLGVLDKGSLRLGDGNFVNFERSLIFMTSNLGARQMADARKKVGFERPERGAPDDKGISLRAAKRFFSPEMINRIDEILAYQYLGQAEMGEIVRLELNKLQGQINDRLGSRAVPLEFSAALKKMLVDRGLNPEYGARELKRIIGREISQPLAGLIVDGKVPARVPVRVDVRGGKVTLKSIAQELRDEMDKAA